MQKLKTIALLLILSILFSTASQAAFPIRSESTVVINNTIGTENILTTETLQQTQWQDKSTATDKKTRHTKNHLVACLLSFFLGAFGAHRFYLGYTGYGIAQAFTLPLVIAMIAILVNATFVSTGLFFFLLGIIALTFFLCFWEISDFIRILTKDLKPKNGNYK